MILERRRKNLESREIRINRKLIFFSTETKKNSSLIFAPERWMERGIELNKLLRNARSATSSFAVKVINVTRT